MRGCPNKCRFCQAGIIYKPFREKNLDTIFKNLEKGLNRLGKNEVTFSSLSSGDYSRILELTETFNNKFKSKHISFSLPSLKVETFDPELLNKISEVRKSGLTFAVEAGSLDGQLTINKPVFLDKVISYINFASKNGWKLIKLYFMIGLPHVANEKDEIIKFIEHILNNNRSIKLNINIGVFIPKPHTPYENEKQLSLDDSIEILSEIESKFRKTRAKIKKHNPQMSYIEGFISRGDEKIGLAMYEVFKKGARFDGWDDQFNYHLYEETLKEMDLKYEDYLEKKKIELQKPWDFIDVGISKQYLSNEYKKSQNREITKSCKDECEADCDICTDEINKKYADKSAIYTSESFSTANNELIKSGFRYLLEFSKKDLLRFIGHIDTIKYFERLFYLSNLKISFTEGFNPHPKMQFSSPLQLGIESECEILEIFTDENYLCEDVLLKLNKNAHTNFSINRMRQISNIGKISLINSVYSTRYCVFFDKIYYNELSDKLIYFDSQEYIFEKNGNTNKGFLKDYVKILDVQNNQVLLEVLNRSNVPKIYEIMNMLFDDKYDRIVKSKMYTKNGETLIELFDI